MSVYTRGRLATTSRRNLKLKGCAISWDSAVPKMGRSSAALACHTSSGAIHLALLLFLFSVNIVGIEAQHDETRTSSEESRVDVVDHEFDTDDVRRLRPFNLIAPRPAREFQNKNVFRVNT